MSKKKDEISEALSLRGQIERFQFVFLTVLITKILESTNCVSKVLQSSNVISVKPRSALLQTANDAIQQIRNEYYSMFRISVEIAKNGAYHNVVSMKKLKSF